MCFSSDSNERSQDMELAPQVSYPIDQAAANSEMEGKWK